MKRGIILGAIALTVLVIVAALLFAGHYRLATLTPTELMLKQPEQPRVLDRAFSAEGCSEVRHALTLDSQSTDSHKKPTKNTTPLSTDEIAIYKVVLQQWVSGERISLNVSATTFPFDATFPSMDFSDCGCLKDIQAETILSVSHSFHDLTPDILPGKHMRLVDATKQATIVRTNDPNQTIGKGKSVNDAVRDAYDSGLFSMSEVVFDKEHHHALVSYSFRCGSLCGSGATLLFEKVGSEWKKTDRMCGGWIS